MRPIPRLLAIFCLAVTAGTAQAGTTAKSTAKLGPGAVLGGGEYSTGGGITVAVELRNWAGKTGLCGVWAESDRLSAYVRRKGGRVLAKGSIALEGRVLTHDLGFLEQVAPAQSYAGAQAGCVRLNRAWQPGDVSRKLEVRLPRQSMLFGANGRNSSGMRIRFGPSQHANPALLSGSVLPRRWTSFGLTPTESD